MKKVFSVILNEVKDLDLVEKTRFFATLRMTKMRFLEFFNSFLDLVEMTRSFVACRLTKRDFLSFSTAYRFIGRDALSD